MKSMTWCRTRFWQVIPSVRRRASLVVLLAVAAATAAVTETIPVTARAAEPAATIETAAREAILIDATTGAVLMEKDADVAMPPASMSKIMTAYMVFTRLKEGRLKLDDTLPVSEKAWKMGGSKMFVQVGTEIRVEDLLQGVIVQSGNDACIVLAEGLAGSEEAFAQAMTEKAHEIGLTNSSFANATGWPDPGQRMTARDLATLALRTIENFPEFYHFYSEKEFEWSDIRQGNRNPLLYKTVGADGLKTGHTEEAGYGLTASAVQDDRRLILVVTGLESVRARSEESERLLRWGFREYDNYALYAANETVDDAPVWLGEASTVPLVAKDDMVLTLPRKARKGMKVSVNYVSPIPAPIEEGEEVAELVVTPSEGDPVSFPLYAGATVGQKGPFGRIVAAVEFLIFGAD
jgi:D-alanyl-D-alanine carboxypeptidase (penicillin-binding protein 5/6)